MRDIYSLCLLGLSICAFSKACVLIGWFLRERFWLADTRIDVSADMEAAASRSFDLARKWISGKGWFENFTPFTSLFETKEYVSGETRFREIQKYSTEVVYFVFLVRHYDLKNINRDYLLNRIECFLHYFY